MPTRLAQQEDGTRECDEVTLRASLSQPRLLSQRAQVTVVTRARSTFTQF